MAGNRIELWGRLVSAPELRTTPAGISVLRITVDAAQEPGGLALAVTMTGEAAARVYPALRQSSEVRVQGTLRAVRRRLNSGMVEVAYEVAADSVETGSTGPEKH